MQLRKIFVSAAVMLLAAAGAVLTAYFAVGLVEDRSRSDVARLLSLNGITWATVEADGLQIVISGTAPDEAKRFSALREAGRVVDTARIIDMMSVEQADAIQPPDFTVEILQNDDGISVIGLVPASTGKDAVTAKIRKVAGATPVTELLDQASYPQPEGWSDALDYGISALAEFKRSKISISPDAIEIVASSESGQDKRRLESLLRRSAPSELNVQIDIAAPRPVVSPYTFRFVLDEAGPRFDACTTDTDAGMQKILAAAREAGMEGQTRCTIGLGVPSHEWDKAVVSAIKALAQLGAGSVTFSDADVTLVGTPEIDAERFDSISGRLKSSLPDVFSLTSVLPEPEVEPGTEGVRGPPEFVVARSADGEVQLRGPVPDDRVRTAILSVAKAAFGAGSISDGMRLREDLPTWWALRVFTSIEALSQLEDGIVRTTQDLVAVSGNTGRQDAAATVAGLLSDKLGEEGQFRLNITYVEQLDPLASIPTNEECVAQINAAMGEQKITFAPSSADIDDAARDTISKIVDIMRDCEHVPMEVAGHTDSQGREIMNKELSQARADAVVNALLARRVLTTNLIATGYGEEQPIADNGTEEGREENRRIEFRLIDPNPEGANDPEAEEPAEGEDGTAGPSGDQQTDEAAPPDEAAEPSEDESETTVE